MAKVVSLFPDAQQPAPLRPAAVKRYRKPLSDQDKLELKLLSHAATLPQDTPAKKAARELWMNKADQAGTGFVSPVTDYLPSSHLRRPPGQIYDPRRKPFRLTPAVAIVAGIVAAVTGAALLFAPLWG